MNIVRMSPNECERETWQVLWQSNGNNEWSWRCIVYRRETRTSKRAKTWTIAATTASHDVVDGRRAERAGVFVAMTELPVDVVAEVRRRATEAPIQIGQDGTR